MKNKTLNAAILIVITTAASTIYAADAVKTNAPARYRWRNVSIVAGGFVDGFVFHPAAKDVLYTRTDIGGAYRWDPAGSRWIPLNDATGSDDGNLLGVESLAVDPTDPNQVYAAVGMYSNNWGGNGAILRSSDRGTTWQISRMPFKMGANEDGRSIGERLAVDPAHPRIVYYGARHSGLWRSSDRAATWTRVTSFPAQPDEPGKMGVVGVGWIVFGPGAIYAGTGDKSAPILRSADGGASWQPLPGQPASLIPHHAISAGNGTLYVSYSNGPGPNGVSGGAVWRLNTASGVWTDITPEKGGFGYAGLSVDRSRPDTVVVATLDRWSVGDTIFRTTDGGAHWADIKPKSVRDSSLSPYLDWHRPGQVSLGHWIGALAIDPFRPGHALYGTGATIWTTNDLTNAGSGKPTHWTVGGKGVEETAVIDLVSPPSGPAHLLSGLGDIGGFRHVDLNVSPLAGMYDNPVMNNVDSLDFAALAPQVVARVGRGGAPVNGALSRDGGATWTPFAAAPGGSRGQSGQVAVSSDGKIIVWTPEGGSASVTRNGGADWTPCAGLPGHLTVISDRLEAERFWAYDGKSGTLYGSRDGGATFASVLAGGPVGERMHLRAAPGRAAGLWLYGETEGLYLFKGNSFTRVAEIASAKSLGFGRAAPGATYPALYVAGNAASKGPFAFFRSDDAGASWIRLNDDAHRYGWAGGCITGDPRVYGRVYVGTNGRGIIEGDLAGR